MPILRRLASPPEISRRKKGAIAEILAFATEMNVGGSSELLGIKNDSAGNYFSLSNYTEYTGRGSVLFKFDSLGTLQWQKSYSNDIIGGQLSMDIDSSDNIYIVGEGSNSTNIRAIKVANSDGSILAQVQYQQSGTSGTLTNPNIKVDSSGDVIIVASRYDDCGIGSFFVVKLNSSFTQTWQRAIDVGPRFVAGGYPTIGITTDSSNNIFVSAGRDFSGNFVPYIAKLNSGGTFQWGRRLTIPVCCGVVPGSIHNLVTDTSGNLYAVGRFNGEIFIIKYNTSGTEQWNSSIGGANNYGFGIAIDSSDNVYVSGSQGLQIAVMAKFNSSGTIQWQRKLTYSGRYTESQAIAIAKSGNVQFGVTSDTGTYFQVIANVPSDGSKTGTFTLYGNTGTYAASSYSIGSYSITQTSTGSVSTPNLTKSTPAVTINIFGTVYGTATGNIV